MRRRALLLIAVVYALFAVYSKIFRGDVVQGWTTLMIAVALGTSAQLFMIGVLGEYVGRIYEEIKGRPLYITAELLNFGAGARATPGPDTRGPSDA